MQLALVMVRGALGLALVACGDPAGGKRTGSRAPADAPPEEIAPEWWLLGERACPEGAVPQGAPPPAGIALGCSDAGGQPHGPYALWHQNGQLGIQGMYWRGRLHGPFTRWDPSGQRTEHGRYAHGGKVGTWTRWHGNGQVYVAGEYVNGREQGEFVYFDATGAKTRVRVYDRGVVIDQRDVGR
jgi:hypothetical protein